jgi:hypothetical protein
VENIFGPVRFRLIQVSLYIFTRLTIDNAAGTDIVTGFWKGKSQTAARFVLKGLRGLELPSEIQSGPTKENGDTIL